MKLSRLFPLALLVAGLLFPYSLFAQDSPEAVYAKWVEVSKAGDVDGLLALSTEAKVKEFREEVKTPEQRLEVQKIMKGVAPVTYKVTKTTLSPDGKKASVWTEGMAIDFFSMNDPKAKPQKEVSEVRLLKENGVWKIDQQCSATDGCGKEPEWTQTGWGKVNPLANGVTLRFIKGKDASFPGIATQGKPFVAIMEISMPEASNTISYFIHRSPTFADFYLQNGDQKVTPIARSETFPQVVSSDPAGPEIKALDDNTTYSQNRNFKGKGQVGLLFDQPKGSQTGSFYATVTYADQKYSFEIK